MRTLPRIKREIRIIIKRWTSRCLGVGGTDGNKGKGQHKGGIITRWDPRLTSDKVNTSNMYQVTEEQKEEAPTKNLDKSNNQEGN